MKKINTSNDYDHDLLVALKKRTQSAQVHIWSRESSALKELAQKCLGCNAENESLVMDVFADFFYNYVDNIRHPAAIGAYLRIMVIRRARRKVEMAEKLVPLWMANCKTESEEEEIDRKLKMEWLSGCLDHLTPGTRQILRLHFAQGLSYTAIAEIRGISKQAVSRIVKCACGKLKKCIYYKKILMMMGIKTTTGREKAPVSWLVKGSA